MKDPRIEIEPFITEQQYSWATLGLVAAIFLGLGAGDPQTVGIAALMTSALKMGEHLEHKRKAAVFYSFAYLFIGASYLFVEHLPL